MLTIENEELYNELGDRWLAMMINIQLTMNHEIKQNLSIFLAFFHNISTWPS